VEEGRNKTLEAGVKELNSELVKLAASKAPETKR